MKVFTLWGMTLASENRCSFSFVLVGMATALKKGEKINFEAV